MPGTSSVARRAAPESMMVILFSVIPDAEGSEAIRNPEYKLSATVSIPGSALRAAPE
jgi:hypothetical protein